MLCYVHDPPIVALATVKRGSHASTTLKPDLHDTNSHRELTTPPTGMLRPHVLKHGLLFVAAMLGGGGRGCPGSTTMTGGSTGSAGGTGGTFAMFVLVQLSVALEQLPAP
jgi:hypothetical protein